MSSHARIRSRKTETRAIQLYETQLQIIYQNQSLIIDLDDADFGEVSRQYNIDQFSLPDEFINSGFTTSSNHVVNEVSDLLINSKRSLYKTYAKNVIERAASHKLGTQR